jgi:hypothetical protein
VMSHLTHLRQKAMNNTVHFAWSDEFSQSNTLCSSPSSSSHFSSRFHDTSHGFLVF